MLPNAYTTEALFCLVSAIICILTGVILLVFSARKTNLYLGLSYLVFGCALTVLGLSVDSPHDPFPHLYRTANIFFLLYMPLSYLYVRTFIRQKCLSVRDLVHLLPLLLYIVDYFPFFLLSGAEKTAIMGQNPQDLDHLLRFREGWLLPANFHFLFRLILMAIYWILQVRLLVSRDAAWVRKDTLWFRWQCIYNALQLPIFVPPLIMILTGNHLDYAWTRFPPAAACLLSALTLLLYPGILYNMRNSTSPEDGRKAKTVLDKATYQQLSREMERYMEDKQPFLHPGFTIGELADAMGVPLHKLSAYINQETGKHFSEYVNDWRIRYCLGLIRNKKIVNLNLNGIATKCGFNNRNTFSTAFKKFTGESPSIYLHANA